MAVALSTPLATACGGDGLDPEPEAGVASVAVTEVPSDVRCIRVAASGRYDVERKFSVSASSSAVLTLDELPLGTVTFFAESFPVNCALTAGRAPNFVSDPVNALLKAGVATPVTLAMHAQGTADVSIDFPSAGDKLAPFVTGVSPEDGQVGVPKAERVSVTFSEPMDATSFGTETFQLSSDLGEALSGSYTSLGTSVTLTPAKPFTPLGRYQALLTADVKDVTGNRLGSAFDWSFTAQDGAWSGPALVDASDAGDALTPRIAVHASGKAVAVWHELVVPSIRNYVAVYAPATGWSTPTQLSANSVERSQVVIDPNGDATVLFTDVTGSSMFLRSVRHLSSSGWQPAESVSNAGIKLHTYDLGESLATDANGNLIAIWQQHNGVTGYDIWTNRYVAGSGWQTPELLESDPLNADHPTVAMNASGDAVASWSQSDGTRHNMYVRRYDAELGWQAAQLVELVDQNAVEPRVSVGPNGHALVTWKTIGTAHSAVRVNRYLPGIGWQPPENVGSSGSGSNYPTAAVDASGAGVVVWTDVAGGIRSVYANSYDPVSGFGAPLMLSAAGRNCGIPQVVFDAHGHGMAVWAESDGTRLSAVARRYVSGTGWAGGSTLLENDSAGDVSQAWVASDGVGQAAAIWRQSNGTRQNVFAARFAN
jgi:hypothetical protein